MSANTNNSKRIAKNTIFLYIRMLFSMVVALYTSRVVLNALGVEDYGLYGVVGGIVVFFNVISGSLNAAISRFITFELGKEEQERLNKVFCTAVNIQLLMSVLFVVLAEIVGVWFLNNHLNSLLLQIITSAFLLFFYYFGLLKFYGIDLKEYIYKDILKKLR